MKTKTTQECPLCEGTGWRPTERQGLRAVEACSCRERERLQNADERAGIPVRYRQCDFETFFDLGNPSLQMAVVKARGFIDLYPVVEKGLLFIGNPGVGKTHLVVAILRDLAVRKHAECLFCSYQELLQKIRDSYNPVSLSTESEVLRPVLESDVVAIDDLGANRVTDWVEDTVTFILNHRYNQKKATILTTNLPDPSGNSTETRVSGGSSTKLRVPETLAERIGVRVRSRLYEMCEEVRISADDFRQTVRLHHH